MWFEFILFSCCVGLLVFTYLLYPLLLLVLSKILRPRYRPPIDFPRQLPFLSVLLSVHNEEKVIVRKLESLKHSQYPPDKIRFYIGSDASVDHTNDRITASIREDSRFEFHPFPVRKGKVGVVNRLFSLACARKAAGSDHILLLTDGNVFHEPDCFLRLIRWFEIPRIGLVDSLIVHQGIRKESGISASENTYLGYEKWMKYTEGRLWGAMPGPFGGCYALRSDLFVPVPEHHLVDDFYLAMQAFRKGKDCLMDREAISYENITHEMEVEYKRKVRISAGNFQNLVRFRSLVWQRPGIGFVLLSHKILRWLGPFFLVMAALLTIHTQLSHPQMWSLFSTFAALGLLGLATTDWVLTRFGVQIRFLRHVRYFMIMNLAFLHGFLRYLKGIRSNVWEPTKRD